MLMNTPVGTKILKKYLEIFSASASHCFELSQTTVFLAQSLKHAFLSLILSVFKSEFNLIEFGCD